MVHKPRRRSNPWEWTRNKEDVVLKRDDGEVVQVWRIVPAILDEQAEFIVSACNAHEAIKEYPKSGIPYAQKIR